MRRAEGTYHMLWGTLLTVRRMVMRPPASTPAARATRACPRKLVVWCSADAAIVVLCGRPFGEHGAAQWSLVSQKWVGWSCWWEWPGAAARSLYDGSRAQRCGARLVDARRATSATRPLAAAAPLDIARRGAQWPAARWRQRSPRPNPSNAIYPDHK